MRVKGTFPVRWKPQDGAKGEGVTIQSQTIKYAKHTSGTVKPTSGWGTSIPTVENGLYLWTWTHIVYSDGNSTDMYSVSRMGVDGKGIQSSVVTYCQQATSVNPDTIAEASWGAFPSDLIDGYWLYTRTVVTYSDGGTAKSYSVSQVGVGSYYAGTEEWYALGASQTEAPEGYIGKGQYGKDANITPTGDWKQERPTANASTPYIWNFSISHDSRDNAYVTDVICIGNFAKGITSIVETYAISAEGTAPSGKKFPDDIKESDWTDEAHAAAPNSEKRYQWNKTETTYNDGTKEYHYHVCAVCGIDGKGAVYIDLDNDNDTMLYDGVGNLVSGAVTSNIVLYANGVKVASQPTFSIKEKSSGVTASISGAVLTVSGCTANSGYVIVKCTYQETEYTARFTAKRLVGTDKYEIILSHNAITHNTDTDVLSASSVSVSVFRTAQNGTRTNVSSLSTYGLTLRCYPNGLSLNTLTPTYSGGSASFDIDSDWDSVDVVLIKDNKELDRESVPIGKVKNGPQGVGAMRLDLDNENDTMLYDDANATCLSGNVESQATLYQGTTPITSGITWSCDTNNCTASISNSGKVTVTAMSGSSGSVTVNAQYGGQTYIALLTLKKIRDNAKYELICNPNAITYNKDTSEISASTVTVQVFKTTSSGRENITTLPSGFTLDVTNGTISKAYGSKYATVKVNEAYDSTVIRLLHGNAIYDSETIPVCKVENGEGTPGANAKSIYKNSFEKPETPTGSSPTYWSNDIVEQTPISVKHQGNWVKDAEGWHVAPQSGNSQTDIQTVQFITTEENQRVYYRVKVNFAYNDDVYVGKVDATTPTKDYNNRLYGETSGVRDTGDAYVDVPTPGVHFICIAFVRQSSTTAKLEHYAKYKLGVMPTWKSDAKTYNEDGSVNTWSAPYKVTNEADEDKEQMRPNLILQSSFISTQMDKWVVKGGQTSVGLDGQNAYYDTNSNTSAYMELLKQLVYNKSTTASAECPIKPETWYTLSFWAKTPSPTTSYQLATYLYPGNTPQADYTYIDTTAGYYVDGVKQGVENKTDNCVNWKLTTQWVRHWMAFKTRNYLPDANQQLLFCLLAGAGTVYVCMPKLEEGIGATAWCANDNDIVDRSASGSGFPNNRGVWVESFADTEQGLCQWNDVRRDYVSYQIDGDFKHYFVKRKGMVVPDNTPPTKGGNTYWEEGNRVSTLLANTIIGTNVEMGGFLVSNNILQSKNGKLELNGLEGLIKLLHDDGYSWQVLENGMQVLGAYPSGQHIQLDPEAKEIRLYNESGSCVTKMSGDTISSLDNIFGSSKGNLTLNSNKSATKTLTQTVTDRADINFKTTLTKQEELSVAEFNTTSETRITVKLSAKVIGYTTTTVADETELRFPDTGGSEQIMKPSDFQTGIDGLAYLKNTATVRVVVKTYEDSAYTTLKKSKQLYILTTNGDGEKSVTGISVEGDVTAGYHKLMVEYTLKTPGYQTTSNSAQRTATANWTIQSASYVSDIYISRIFANGVAFGTSANNYFAAMNVNGKMLVKGVTLNGSSQKNGFELSATGLSILHKDASFRPVVTLGMGILQYTSSGVKWKSFQNGLRGCTNPTVSGSKGYYTINFPTEWQNIIGSTTNNLFITAIACDVLYTSSVPTVVTIPFVYSDKCTIVYKSTVSAAQEYIMVKVEYMLP